MYCNTTNCIAMGVQWLGLYCNMGEQWPKLYCNREVCWLGHYIVIHLSVLWLRRQGLWDKIVTIQSLYCDIGAD